MLKSLWLHNHHSISNTYGTVVRSIAEIYDPRRHVYFAMLTFLYMVVQSCCTVFLGYIFTGLPDESEELRRGH